MHHCLLCQGFVSFFERPAHQLARDGRVLGELGHFVGQEPDRPAAAPFWRIGAGKRHEQGLLFPGEFGCGSWPGLLQEGSFESLFDAALTGALDGCMSAAQRFGDEGIGAAFVGQEQRASAAQAACLGLALRGQIAQIPALLIGEVDGVLLCHGSVGWRGVLQKRRLQLLQ